MKYEGIIQQLENIKANELDVKRDYEAVEVIDNAITKLKQLQ